jgi:hypothetical protein
MAFRFPGLLTALTLTLSVATTSAAEPEKKSITKLFDVADLVAPLSDFTVDAFTATPIVREERKPPLSTAESGERLTKLVTSMVRPYSWSSLDGAGRAEYFDIGSTLVVTNAPDVIAEVADLLEAVRRLQSISITTEVRVLRVPVGFCDQFGVKREEGGITDSKVRALLEVVQGFTDATVTQYPRVTTHDGQEAIVRVGERMSFVTGADIVKVKGQTVLVPRKSEVDLGDTLSLTARASADRKYVDLSAKLARTTLVGEVELIPVTMTIRPVFEGGSQGQPIPFTQYLQSPDFKTRIVEKSIVVPTGGTVILGGWNEPGIRPPTISKIPYLNRLYKNTGSPACEVIVLATTRVIQEPIVEPAPLPRPIGAFAKPVPIQSRATSDR